MDEPVMTMLTTYRLRAESCDALWQLLADASDGKARPYAWAAVGGRHVFDESRVRLPWPEIEPGDSDELVDTGFWLCDVALVGEPDAGLSEIAVFALEAEID